MLRAAVHVAVDMVLSNFGGLHPHLSVLARLYLPLHPKLGHIKGMDDILRDHGELHRLVHGNMEFVVLPDSIRMLHVPHPLLANHKDLFGVLWWLVDLAKELGCPDKDP